MAVNKVIYGSDTLIDLTEDDVTAGDVAAGKSFHLASGVRTVGTAVVPEPATNAPLMDGTAAVGVSTAYAREDHVHPRDTSLGASLSISNYNLSLKNASNTTLNTVAIPHDLPFLMFINTVVPVASFVSDQTYASFPYRAAVALTGVTSAMVPDVIFSLDDGSSGAFSTVSESYNGGIYIYRDSAPTDPVTIPTIIAWNNG